LRYLPPNKEIQLKAIIWTNYGPPDVLQIQDVEKPSPKENEVLVRIMATTVTAGDCEARSLKFPLFLALPMRLYTGVRKPSRIKILGQEMSGIVEAVGEMVKRFNVGDHVFGSLGFGMGAYAEYVCIPEKSDEGVLVHKPTNMSFEEAATVPTGGLESLHFLRKAKLKPGDSILINGAGGSIGTYGVQLAKYYGAEITAVDRREKLEMLISLGADHVIDYHREDFTQNGLSYDVIFDIVGKSPYSRSIRSLKQNGRYLIANPRPSLMTRGRWTSKMSDKQVIFELAGRKTEDLRTLVDLIEEGVLKSVIDKRFPLEQTAEAHRYVETGQKKGNVVITVA
jgi:NADPH:quinone reductase-like Zn-dependent oxidoreductase